MYQCCCLQANTVLLFLCDSIVTCKLSACLCGAHEGCKVDDAEHLFSPITGNFDSLHLLLVVSNVALNRAMVPFSGGQVGTGQGFLFLLYLWLFVLGIKCKRSKVTEMSNSQSLKGVLALTPNCKAIDTAHKIVLLPYWFSAKLENRLLILFQWRR